MHRSEEIAESNGRPTAAIWLAAHAWFEGAVAALASAAQLTDRHPRGPFGLPFPEHRTPVITRRSIRP